MRNVIGLNQLSWFVGAVEGRAFPAGNDFANVEGWIPATVPGDVRLDLLNIHKIPDPFLGRNDDASRWVDAYDWWYRCEVLSSALPGLGEGQRTFLIFEGIDYQSAVYWNDVQLGTHVGMFSRQVYEIPREKILDGVNRIVVRVSGGDQLPRMKLNAQEQLWREVAGRVLPHAANAGEFPDRYATLKCQMSYGWDFAPRLLTCGIWDEAFLAQTREIFIRSVWVQGVPDGRARVTLDLDAAKAREIQVRFRVRPHNFEGTPDVFEMPLRVGRRGTHTFALELNEPRVWNPWDRGEPNLYVLETTVLDEHGEMDRVETRFGLRTTELVENEGAAADAAPWTFLINGQREFIRGANWVPADAIPARVTREDYAKLLQLARDANINLLRVWGGGLKEKAAFYELCDEMGMLVWQEFPFSGAGVDYFPNDSQFLELARQESAEIVRALRNHPSVMLWCGGNEFIPRANKHVIEVLRNAVAVNDGTRPFKPASPSAGESHNWRVWHGMANTRDYEKDRALFFGEFGLQAAPNVETLQRFLPDEAIYPPNEDWGYHNAEIEKLWRYARPLLGEWDLQSVTLEEFVAASQEAQLRGLQIAIEYARRSKPRVSGCLFWQFNEPWYSICWSVVDYTRTPKRAYWKIKELYNPVLVSFAFPYQECTAGEIVSGRIWLVNDTLRELRGTLKAWHNDRLVLSLEAAIQVDGARAVESLDLQLDAGANALRLEFRGDGFVSTNEYDLNYCDIGEIQPRRALATTAAAWLRTSR